MQPRVSTLEVILANVDFDDRFTLKSMLQDTRWSVVVAASDDMERVVRGASVPIVLCERGLSNYWRKTVSVLMKARRDACVILISGGQDLPDVEEVSRYGVFDVLTRPLLRAEVLPMLLFAYTYWRGHGPLISRVRREHISP